MNAFINWWRTWIWGEGWSIYSTGWYRKRLRCGIRAHMMADLLSLYLEKPMMVVYEGESGAVHRGKSWYYGEYS